jgi:hypothetical protein
MVYKNRSSIHPDTPSSVWDYHQDDGFYLRHRFQK